MKKIIALALVASLFGCAQTQPQQATHNWGAKNKTLARTFVENNNQCSTEATNVESYEVCMKSYGYLLLSQR